jgi:hypothetical protein
MKITKDIEIEIDVNDLKDDDLFDELEERIEDKFILCTDEHKAKMQPQIEEMIQRLTEIRNWLRY